MFDGNVNHSYHFSYNPTSGSGNGHDGQAPSKVASDGMDVMAAYKEAEDVLEKAQTTQEVKDRLYRLYQLSGVSGEEQLKGRFNQFISKASTGANRVFNLDTHQKTLQNSAMILQAKSLVRDKKYEELAGYLDKAKASALKGMDRRDWLHLTAVSQTYHGNFKQALNTIEAYKAHQKAQGVSVEEYEQVHQYLEEDIRLRMKEAGSQDQRSKEGAGAEEKE